MKRCMLFAMCFSKQEIPTLFDNLERPLDLSSTDHSLWNDKCDYYEVNEIQNLNPNNKILTILQLNIRSLLRKQTKINILLNKLYYKKSLPKILLSETHLSDSKLRHLNIPNYTTLSCNRLNKSGGGVAIMVHNLLTSKERHDLNILNKEKFGMYIFRVETKIKPPENNWINLPST